MLKNRIGVLFGGRSEEHEVSLSSACFVIKALNPDKFEPIYIGITKDGEWKKYEGPSENIKDGSWEKYSREFTPGELKNTVDFVLPVLHGPYGEDGCIQGFLETMNIPYGGCGVLASSVSMDKDTAGAAMKVIKAVNLPCFVKPANMGSSVGISKAKTKDELVEALKNACRYDDKIVAEEFIEARELEIAVLGEAERAGEENDACKLTCIGEILPEKEFYDYKAKYMSCRTSKLIIPADIEPEAKEKITKMARRAYKAVGGFGFGRVDFFMEKSTGKIYINEINTIPGFTEESMFPLLWQKCGLTPRQIIERIIDLGYERYHAENNRKTKI